MGFVIKRRKWRRFDDGSLDTLYTESQLGVYVRFLERMLHRRGVKYPAQRFQIPKLNGESRVRRGSPR